MAEDFIGDIMNSTFLGVPTIFILAVIGIVFFLIYKMKGSGKPKFKRMSLTKEIKLEFDRLYNQYNEKINKPMRAGGFMRVGYAIGFFPLFWDKRIEFKKNMEANKLYKKYLKKHPELFNKDGKLRQDVEEMVCIKTCGKNKISQFLAKTFGFKTSYRIVPSDKYTVNEKELQIDMFMNPSYFFGVTVYSKTGKDYIENIAYKLNRQNELDEFVNQIPKQNYLEVSTASSVAKARESAQIEKEKYKGQIENVG